MKLHPNIIEYFLFFLLVVLTMSQATFRAKYSTFNTSENNNSKDLNEKIRDQLLDFTSGYGYNHLVGSQTEYYSEQLYLDHFEALIAAKDDLKSDSLQAKIDNFEIQLAEVETGLQHLNLPYTKSQTKSDHNN